MEWILGLVATIITAFVTARLTAKNEEKRIREELKLEYSIETAIVQLLEKQKYDLRSFRTIKYHIRGFEDDVLRQHLVRAGAIAFEDPTRKSEGPDKVERWGLLNNPKNIERLHKANDPD